MSEAMTMTATALAAPGLWAILKEDLACVFQRDPAARSTLEVLTTYPGVHAVLTHRLSHKLWRAGWRFPARSPAESTSRWDRWPRCARRRAA